MNSSQPDRKCYHIYYTKDIYKKKKIYKEGILLLSSNNIAKIFDEDGQLITQYKMKEKIQIDQQYIANNSFIIMIDREGNIDEYNTGTIFVKKQMMALPIRKKQMTGLNIYSKSYKSEDIIRLQCGLVIERKLYDVLRPHQREGVQFMYNCVSGKKNSGMNGCILADFMGLGKTLQTLALAYSMIRQKQIKKFVIVCPLTLLTVWQKQTKKWLQQRIVPLICYGDGTQTTNTAKIFASHEYRMLVISYQTFYKNIEKLSGKCDLIIFDEGHRMKNKKSKLLLKMKIFKCDKRILLTGTLIQNNLQQLYTCISIINPRIFLSQLLFKNVYQKPILDGLAKRATFQQKKLAKQRTNQLARQIRQFSLRRNIDILQQFLPQKYQYIIFMNLTPLQKLWYERIVQNVKFNEQDIFCTLTSLRKLFIHPSILKTKKINSGECQYCLEDCSQEISPKIQFTIRVVEECVKNRQKCVVVSYYTETLDFIAQILKNKYINYTKLDGRLKGKQRKYAIAKFENSVPVLLLSGKAGGTGLTLVCAVRMIMLQPDWNPSNDSQVMARIWRQGQTKQVHIYRLLIASTFQQKMLQRQGLKKRLADNLIDNESGQGDDGIDFENLGKLFISYRGDVISYQYQENQIQQFQQRNTQLFANTQQNNDKSNNTINNHNGIIFVKIKKSGNEQTTPSPKQNEFNTLSFQDFVEKENNQNNYDNEDQDNCSSDEELSDDKIEEVEKIVMGKKKEMRKSNRQENYQHTVNQEKEDLFQKQNNQQSSQNKLFKGAYQSIKDGNNEIVHKLENSQPQSTTYQNQEHIGENILITKINQKISTVPFGQSNILKKIKKK